MSFETDRRGTTLNYENLVRTVLAEKFRPAVRQLSTAIHLTLATGYVLRRRGSSLQINLRLRHLVRSLERSFYRQPPPDVPLVRVIVLEK